MSDLSITSSTKWMIVAIAAVIWFSLLGYRDLMEPDEGRYAEIPREMVATGDWTTPRLNDLKYFEKPVFQYWMTAVSFSLFGESNATARLWVALISFLGALWVMFVAGRLWGEAAGFYAFLVSISGLLYVAMGHIITLDMTVSVFLGIGVGALLIAQSNRDNLTQVRNWMLLGWAALGIATLTKGLIGLVLPGAAIVLYSLWMRDWALWKHLHLGKGLLLFLLVTAPWFIAVSLANPEFLEFFFIHEHFDRYTSTVHMRDKPWWYFLAILLLGAVPWISAVTKNLFKPDFAWLPAKAAIFDPIRFLWVFAVFIFVFFSMGSSQLPAYLLPMFPALSLMIGKTLAENPRLGPEIWLMPVVGLVFLVAAWQIDLVATSALPAELLHTYRPWWLAATGLMFGGFWLVRHFGAAGPKAITALALTALLSVQLLSWGYQTLSSSRSSRTLAEQIRPYVDAGAPVYTVETYPQSLPFYLGKPVQLAIMRSELDMGIRQEPEKWIPSFAEFKSRWLQDEQAIAVFDAESFSRFNFDEMPMQIIYRDPRKLAVIRR